MQKIIVIAGVTGSGKTALSIELARAVGGEIIVADSRTVYRGMDIGTAKVTKDEQGDVPHHGLDLVLPNEPWTVFDFKQFAERTIDEIVARGHVPIVVGGTGLYLSALTDNYDFATKSVGEKKYEVLTLMTRAERETLYARVDERVDAMIASGFEEEVRRVYEEYGAAIPSMTGIGYRQFVRYIRGEITFDEAVRQMKRDSRHYAKRQWTWWRHHGDAKAVSGAQEAIALATDFLKE